MGKSFCCYGGSVLCTREEELASPVKVANKEESREDINASGLRAVECHRI